MRWFWRFQVSDAHLRAGVGNPKRAVLSLTGPRSFGSLSSFDGDATASPKDVVVVMQCSRLKWIGRTNDILNKLISKQLDEKAPKSGDFLIV